MEILAEALINKEGWASLGVAVVGSLGVYITARYKARQNAPAELLRESSELRRAFREDNVELRDEVRQLREKVRTLEEERDQIMADLRRLRKKA